MVNLYEANMAVAENLMHKFSTSFPLHPSLAPNLSHDCAGIVARTASNAGLTLKSVLGYGAWGIVFETDHRVVVKVFADFYEAQIVHDLIENGLHLSLAGLPTFHDLFSTDLETYVPKMGNMPVFTMIRENIEPVDVTYEQHDILELIRDTVFEKPIDMHRYYLNTINSFKSAHGLGSILAAMKAVYEEMGVMLIDVHGGNVGKRISLEALSGKPPMDDLVAFDLGHSVVPDRKRRFKKLGRMLP